MSQTAYISQKGTQRIEVVSYEIGPVFVDLEAIKLSWYRNSFRPQPTGATWSATANTQIGDGQSGQFVGGSYVNDNDPTAIVIAVPDEMQASPVPPRTLQHDKTFMVFYGESGAPVAATRSVNTLVVPTGHPFVNGQMVTIKSTTTPPGGLEVLTLYYVRDRAAGAISLAATPGGSVITLSSAGTGTHTVVPFKMTGFYPMSKDPSFSNNRPLGLL
jgi:hypothetical protein